MRLHPISALVSYCTHRVGVYFLGWVPSGKGVLSCHPIGVGGPLGLVSGKGVLSGNAIRVGVPLTGYQVQKGTKWQVVASFDWLFLCH